MNEFELKLISVQTLANDASVLRYTYDVTEGPVQPGDIIEIDDRGMRLSIFRSDANWLEFLLEKTLGASLASKQTVNAKLDTSQRLTPINDDDVALVMCDEQGFAAGMHIATHWLRMHRGAMLCLFTIDTAPPFAPRPSQFLIPGIRPDVTAAVPLLEDWGIPSRLVSYASMPGVFDGSIRSLATAWIETLSEEQLANLHVYLCGYSSFCDNVSIPSAKHIQRFSVE